VVLEMVLVMQEVIMHNLLLVLVLVVVVVVVQLLELTLQVQDIVVQQEGLVVLE
jgi:hypothetical protein